MKMTHKMVFFRNIQGYELRGRTADSLAASIIIIKHIPRI